MYYFIIVLAWIAIWAVVWHFVAKWFRSRKYSLFISHSAASSVGFVISVLFLVVVLPSEKKTPSSTVAKNAAAPSSPTSSKPANLEPVHSAVHSPEPSSDPAVKHDNSHAIKVGVKVVNDGSWLGCLSKKQFSKIMDYLADGDRTAFEKAATVALDEGDCTTLHGGEEVKLMDVTILGHLIKVRHIGDTEEYWTIPEAVSEEDVSSSPTKKWPSIASITVPVSADEKNI
jgi:hypothetical protein